jgi:amino acid adenylation domain-containing protein
MSSNPTLANSAFRISSQQERAWSQQEKGARLFAQCVIQISGAVDGAQLRHALEATVAQYEILRTALRKQTGVKLPFQVIEAKAQLAFQELGASMSLEELLRSAREFTRASEPVGLHAVLAPGDQGEHCLTLSAPIHAADVPCLKNLCAELALAYGEPHPAKGDEDPMQYPDIVEWQHELLASEETKSGREFWRDACGRIDFEALSRIQLPLEGEQQHAKEFTPETPVLSASPQVVSMLRNVASQMPEEIALLTVWHALLARLTGKSDLVVGCEFDGRRYEELLMALGPLARILPLTFKASDDPSFRTLSQEVAVATKRAQDWQESFAWGQLFERESPELPLSYAYYDLGEGWKAGGVEFGLKRVQVVSERFKLRLVGVRRGGELELEFHYDASRLNRAVVERIAGWYQRLLAAALSNPEQKISALPLLSEEERHQLLVEWNETAAGYPATRCLQELFEAQAQRAPERVAVRCGEQALTYAELNLRANQLAHYLRRVGVGPDKLVGLCLERSAESMVAVLAILKAGGAYVPLNPVNPPARLRQQLEGAVAVITEKKLAGQVPEFPGTTLVLDGEPKPWMNEPGSNPTCTTTPENLVYVIYTSGSTGVPKGVAVRHRNLVNYSDFISKRLQLDKHSEGLQFATVSTLGADLGNTCIYPSLISGGTLHVIGYEMATDGSRFAQYATQYGIDVLKIVPSHMAALLQSQADSEDAKKLLPRRYLIFGGETLKPQLLEKIEALHPGCTVLNHYGPTETTVGSLTLKLDEYDWKAEPLSSIPIGRPIQNTQVYVLDQNLEPVPVGVTGELYIAGAGVTAGYLNQPGKTAERFLMNPFSADANAKMYRTGDLARYGEGGEIEFLGRGDDQVKVRGFRIELGEIEAVLARHAGVKQALVLARENEQGEKRLLAYVVAQAKELTGEDLREHLKQELPDYMVPQAIAILAKFPLTPNGKIDRNALPEPEQATAKRAYIAPRTETEKKIAEIWAEVLRRQIDTISIDDNFFDLGGHSLMATQVVSRIRERFSLAIPMRAMFDRPTIARLGETVTEAQDTPDEDLSIAAVSREAYRS